MMESSTRQRLKALNDSDSKCNSEREIQLVHRTHVIGDGLNVENKCTLKQEMIAFKTKMNN